MGVDVIDSETLAVAKLSLDWDICNDCDSCDTLEKVDPNINSNLEEIDLDVLSVSDTVRIMVVPGDRIFIDRKMIEEIKTEEFGTISLILDNYVVGIVPKGS